jgi:hypothetical protein
MFWRLITPVARSPFVTHDDGGARLQHLLPGASDRDRLVGEPDAPLDRVREVDQTVVLVEDPDVDDLSIEDLLQPIADEVVHRLQAEPLGQGPLDVLDER